MPGTDPSLGSALPSVVVGSLDPLIGLDLGGYRVTRLLASGGMGLVYEALHETIGRRAAVKVLKPEVAADAEWTRRFLSEARALGSLKHRNLIEVLNFGKTPDGREFLMMEFLEGEPLDAYMRRLGMLPPSIALSITEQILNGLSEAHKKGVVHRDLKPSNVYLLREHNAELLVKVLDFGLARMEPVALVEDVGPAPARTDGASLLAGTPEYIAPEQAQGRKVDARADLYALGVMLFEMLTGRLPFEAPNVAALLQLHLSQPAPKLGALLRDVPAELEAFVSTLLEKDPERRPASADEARLTAQRLLKHLAQETTAVRAAPHAAEQAARYAPTSKIVRPAQDAGTARALAEAFPQRARRRWGLLAVLGLALLAGVGWWAARPPSPASEPPVVDARPVEPPLPPVTPEPPPPAAVEEPPLEPLPIGLKAPAPAPQPPPIAVRPVPVEAATKVAPVVRKTPVVIEPKDCAVTEAWRRSVQANLGELASRAADVPGLYETVRAEARRLSSAAREAKTVNDCVQVSTDLQALIDQVMKP